MSVTLDEPYRMPMDYGVVEHPTRRAIVVYRLVPEIETRTAEYQAGGTITHHVATGRRVYQANVLGNPALIELTPELCAAIEADLKRRGISL